MKIFIAQSIDGYIAGPDGSVDHMTPYESNDYGYDGFVEGCDGVIMGRNTLDAFYPQHDWPFPESMPACIMTHRILPQGLPAHIRASESIEIAAEKFPNSYIDGGFVISQFLMRNLIREAHIFTLPIMLGTGVPLFAEGAAQTQTWQLLGSRSYPCGTVENHYTIPAN